MATLLDVNNISFTIWNYPMSYIEFFGTIFNILCVWLVAKNRIINWPIGIIGTILFMFLFLQIRLYADFFEQIYFLITGFWGWWAWTQGRRNPKEEKPIRQISLRGRLGWLTLIAVGTLVSGYFISNIHLYFPQFFTEPASSPYLDSFTTVMSFVATVLLVYKQFEAWYLWILVDIIGICLYWVKEVRLVSLLYVIFLVLATKGLFNWLKLYGAGAKKHD